MSPKETGADTKITWATTSDSGSSDRLLLHPTDNF